MIRRVGIIGAGQLGKMLAEAMLDMSVDFVLYDSQSDACGRTVGHLIHSPFDDLSGLDQLIASTDIITCEFENVPADSLEYVASRSSLIPNATAFRVASHRLREKAMFTSLGIPCADSLSVESLNDLQLAVSHLGFPVLLKTCSGGYDGKGQVLIRDSDGMATCYDSFTGLSCIAEKLIDFKEEVSCIIVRSSSDEIRSYPLIRNLHKQGILRLSVPNNDHHLYQKAFDYASRIARHLDYVGVLALECFVTRDDQLLANEIAPRVHNSGHWTIEGAQTSQFANHIRAIMGMPLGDTSMTAPSAMINLLGYIPSSIQNDRSTFVHVYGKQMKPRRKVGHITILASDENALEKRIEQVCACIYVKS